MGTIIVLAVVGVAAAFAIRSIIRDKRRASRFSVEETAAVAADAIKIVLHCEKLPVCQEI